MDDLMARTMVENLSIGIDPITGHALPRHDSCANEVVQEALRMVLDNCTLESYGTILEKQRAEREEKKKERKAQRAERYPNGGKPWTKAEDKLLREMYIDARKNIYQIANLLERTPSAVSTRLKKLGLRIR